MHLKRASQALVNSYTTVVFPGHSRRWALDVRHHKLPSMEIHSLPSRLLQQHNDLKARDHLQSLEWHNSTIPTKIRGLRHMAQACSIKLHPLQSPVGISILPGF